MQHTIDCPLHGPEVLERWLVVVRNSLKRKYHDKIQGDATDLPAKDGALVNTESGVSERAAGSSTDIQVAPVDGKWGGLVQISLRPSRKQAEQCAYLTVRMEKLFEEQRVDFTNMLATITNKQS